MQTTTPRTAAPELSRTKLPAHGPIPNATMVYLAEPLAFPFAADPEGHWSDAVIWALIGSMLYWTQLGRAGRCVVKWVRATILKHGAWLSATALLSLAIGMAA